MTLPRRDGFTLIELLVVIAVVVLLIGILLPALGLARENARATACSVNARSIAQVVQLYTTDYGIYPPSYVYADAPDSETWVMDNQGFAGAGSNGYIHWSFGLLNFGGKIAEGAFSCPSAPRGGAPCTNPGPEEADWELNLNQQNDLGQGYPGPLQDRQAQRMAYTGNAAVFTRNKFRATTARRNQLVKDAWITFPARTILATEFLQLGDWSPIFEGQRSKSHRPITPFYGGSAGTDVYQEPDSGGATPRFFYPQESEILRKDQLGPGMIVDGNTILNAVGRTHKSADKRIGGSANFSFIDGHVERTTVTDTIKRRLWGDKFWSLTGRNVRVDEDGF